MSVIPIGEEIDATALAQGLLGSGVAISNVTYTGSDQAAGIFSGGLTEDLGLGDGGVTAESCV
jgi:hypothetical protein